MAISANIGAGIGAGLIAIGTTIAALHLWAWAAWRYRRWQDARHWTIGAGTRWIRPFRPRRNRQIRL